MNYRYPENVKGLIDVTKPPYCLDNTGKEDCTETLIQIIDSIIRENFEGIEKLKQKLDCMDASDADFFYELRKYNGRYNIPFAEKPVRKTIYFPNGTYLITDTITYTLRDIYSYQQGIRQMEASSFIRFLGESMEGVTIKLSDNNPAFKYGSERPMIKFLLDQSNVAFSNSIENITLDVGVGNPGAIGVDYFANNCGYVSNLTIKSSDPDGAGYAGFIIKNEINSAGYIKNLTVNGFDYGIRVLPLRHYVTFENVYLKKQRRAGVFVGNTVVSIRNLQCVNNCTGVMLNGPHGHAIILDSLFTNDIGGSYAINNIMGTVFARNIDVSGYGGSLRSYGKQAILDPHIEEFNSEEAIVAFETEKRSLDLCIEDFDEREVWDENFDNWANVYDYGAVGDGVTDDYEAIQKALNSGKEYIVFGEGEFFVNKTLIVPPCVKRINFLFGGFVTGNTLKSQHDIGVLKVVGDTETPLIIENVLNWIDFFGSMYFVNHASKRTLILRNIMNFYGLTYMNSVEGGKVFLDNCCSVIDGDVRSYTPFKFIKQKVWARNINPERSYCQILNDGGEVWILGFKTEGYLSYGTSFKTVNNGKTEIFGGTVSIGGKTDNPIIINENSDVSMIAVTNGYSPHEIFPIAVKETQNGTVKLLRSDDFPKRILSFYHVPLYVGRNSDKK